MFFLVGGLFGVLGVLGRVCFVGRGVGRGFGVGGKAGSGSEGQGGGNGDGGQIFHGRYPLLAKTVAVSGGLTWRQKRLFCCCAACVRLSWRARLFWPEPLWQPGRWPGTWRRRQSRQRRSGPGWQRRPGRSVFSSSIPWRGEEATPCGVSMSCMGGPAW